VAMASPREVGVAARTSLAVLALLVGQAAADPEPDDSVIIGADPGWRIEDVQVRGSFFAQHGQGFQSQAGGDSPGSELMYMFQPSTLITVRQNANIVHQVMVPVDAITAASPDAVDAISTASRRNIAFDVDVRSKYKLNEHDTLTSRVMAHGEEPMGGGVIGIGWQRGLADDNASVSVNGSLGIDGFDDHDHFGDFLGKTARETLNANVSASQLLSPTTVVDGSYGVTYQHGTLRTGWNAVPTTDGLLTDEVLPRGRVRQALSARLAQFVPATRTALKAWYRLYHDGFGIDAHTIEASAYQYVASWIYVRGSYRFHHQDGADFFTTAIAKPFDDMTTLRTADSDLAPFDAHEWSVSATTVRGRGPWKLWSFSAELMRYTRSNDLRITVGSLSFGRLL